MIVFERVLNALMEMNVVTRNNVAMTEIEAVTRSMTMSVST